MPGIPEVKASDVASRYDGDLAAEFREDYVEAQIADAVDYATSRWQAQMLNRLASGTLTDNLYKRTIANAVLRVLRNPGGLASENEGGYGYSTRADVASGNLWFTTEEIANLIGVSTPTVGTIGVGMDRGWH